MKVYLLFSFAAVAEIAGCLGFGWSKDACRTVAMREVV